MLTCRELVQNLTSDYLDGQLTIWQWIAVRFHLLICAHCQRFMRQMRLVRGLLARRPTPAPTQDEVSTLAAHLHQAYLHRHDHRHE
jgi:predicted anti-sigma-YlaC factor YlaD